MGIGAGDGEVTSPAVGAAAVEPLRNGKTWKGPAAAPTAPSSPSEVMPVRINISINEMKIAQEADKVLSKRDKNLSNKDKVMNDTLRAQQLFLEAYPEIRYGSVKELYRQAHKFISKHVTKELTFRRIRSIKEGKARRIDGEELDALRLAVIEESKREQSELRARLAALDAKLARVDEALARTKVAADSRP